MSMPTFVGMAKLAIIPADIRGGESLWISASNPDYPQDIIVYGSLPDTHNLSYTFSTGISLPLTVEGLPNGDGTGWTLELTPAQTLAFTPGPVRYTGQVTNKDTGRVKIVDEGTLFVMSSPARASHWGAVVQSIDAAIADYASNPNGRITMGDMSVSYRSIDELIRLREYAIHMLQADSGRSPRRIIRTRFT